MTPLRGFTPDAPSTTPGIVLDCAQFIPYEAGMRSAPAPLAYSAALAAECLGAVQLSKLDATRRTFAGTASKLYELSVTSWTDRSRVGDYALAAGSRWSFTQFGDASLAANIDNVIQASTSGAFANQATAPQATVIEAVLSSGGGFVFAFNTIDGTYGTSPDRWWCSAVNDHTSWTPSPSTQATTGRLLGTEGRIVAARRLGADRIVAYKRRAMYAGSYVGPPAVWAWQELPGFGCVGLDAVANLGHAHFVVGEENIFIFDGSRPQIVDQKVHRWFMSQVSEAYMGRTIVQYDRTNGLVWVFFASTGSTTGQPDMALVYHLARDEWGRADRTIEAALTFVKPATSFDGDSGTFDAAVGTFDSVPETRLMSVFDTAHVLSPLEGSDHSSTFTLHDIGDDDAVTRLTEVALRFEAQPDPTLGGGSVTLYPSASMSTGVAFTPGNSFNAADVPGGGVNRFQLRQTARFHRLQFAWFGDARISGYRVSLLPAGRR